MPEAGEISGGSVALTTTTPVREISLMYGFALRGHLADEAPPPGGVFISTDGSDATGDGTQANPWRTLGKGMAEVAAGGRLNLRGGTYRLSSGFTWTASGTLGNEITVASYPGEVATIDANAAEFQAVGNTQWELFDESTETYRSAGNGYQSGTWVGSGTRAAGEASCGRKAAAGPAWPR